MAGEIGTGRQYVSMGTCNVGNSQLRLVHTMVFSFQNVWCAELELDGGGVSTTSTGSDVV